MNDLNKHKKSDSVKWFFTAITFILLFVMIAGICLQVFGTGKMKPSEWIKPDEEQQEQTADNGGAVINTPTENGIKLMSAKIPVSQYAANGISEQAETAYTLTATIDPVEAGNKAVDWSVRFVNPSSSWATGKIVTDYVTINPTSDGALTANVECKKAFGEQIKVVVTARANSEAKAECTLDYARRILDTALYMPILDDDYLLEFGSNEIVVDMVTPNFKDFVPGMTNNTIWTDGYFDIFLDDSIKVEDDSDDTIFDKSLEKTYRFSDYTIKDCLICSLNQENEYLATRSFDYEIADGFYTIIEKMYYECTPSGLPMNDITEGVFSNNPVAMAMKMFEKSNNRLTRFNEASYNKYLAEFIKWIKDNPNTPIIKCTMTVTGKHSTFTREFSFRFNPETAVMPVFGVSLDNSNLVF